MNFVALRMLTGDRGKYLGLVFAIAFSTFLLENQTSIFVGILKRTGARIADVTDAEVWVMDAETQYFEESKALRDSDLLRVRSVPGIEWAVRLLKNAPIARTDAGRFAQTSVLGLDDVTLVGVPRKMVLGSWERLREPDAIVIDHAGYELLYPGEPLQLGRTLHLNDHLVRIVGISDASATFISFPLIHARYSVALNFQGRERAQMTFVLARPQAGITPLDLVTRIHTHTGLRARTSDGFIWDCIRYTLLNTGIPVNFGITIAIAIFVGAVVAGQTFYLFTLENLSQFGALKAIGVTNGRLVGMILLQAGMVGVIGFAIGTGVAAAFFDWMSKSFVAARGMIMPWQNVALTAACIFVVVIASSLLSIRRVLVLEPAAVFRA